MATTRSSQKVRALRTYTASSSQRLWLPSCPVVAVKKRRASARERAEYYPYPEHLTTPALNICWIVPWLQYPVSLQYQRSGRDAVSPRTRGSVRQRWDPTLAEDRM